MKKPQVSVVMSVYNEQTGLDKTLQSILDQRDVELEFIIVNDGSTDQSEAIIREHMNDDKRIVLINQNNAGLTQSLITGCQHAKADYIARQDGGDTSLPNRLAAQLAEFTADTSLALVSAATRFVAPDGEIFKQIALTKRDARNGLKQTKVNLIKGPPHHGSVMFKKSLYQQVGGYRKEFIVAQDLDLWTRLIETGEHSSLQNILYQATADKHSISNLQRNLQLQATASILQCVQERNINGNDQTIIKSMNLVANTQKNSAPLSDKTEADFYYFIASNLKDQQHPASRKYFKKALQANPWHWKARLKLLC